MIKIENTVVMGWEAAIRGMRNPMNSWEKSDSFTCETCKNNHPGYDVTMREECGGCCSWDSKYESDGAIKLGPNDFDLMMRLRKSGTPDHRKFMRMIVVYVDIIAPLYWWKEFDTYKVGTVANSCSTMHKIAAKRLVRDDFSHEHLMDGGNYILNSTIDMLNEYRAQYLETKDKKYWWQMIQLLPSSYNQRRTVMLNYEVLTNIYHARKNHKLDEWAEHNNIDINENSLTCIGFCDWVKTLPYSELITLEE